jgi:hypothetical protein
LASKVYYYLGEYDEALSFALGAGSAFEAESRVWGAEEYVETVVCELNRITNMGITNYFYGVAKAIDRYIQLRTEARKEKIDPRLQTIIEGIFRRCIEDGEYKQVLFYPLLFSMPLIFRSSRPLELLLNPAGLTSFLKYTKALAMSACYHTQWKPFWTQASHSLTVTKFSALCTPCSHLQQRTQNPPIYILLLDCL